MLHTPQTVPTPTAAESSQVSIERLAVSRGTWGLGGRWPSPTSTTAPGGPESGVCFMVTLLFGVRGVSTSASLGIRRTMCGTG
jgi:hypothetical protein